MAGKSIKLIVTVSPSAQRDLKEIWTSNATENGSERANWYLAFLHKRIQELETDFPSGTIVLAAPTYRFITAKFSSAGHGHHIVYQIFQDQVEVLRIFHERQNWREILENNSP